MADLDFKHSVQERPQAAPLPNAIKNDVQVETQSTPNYQRAGDNYAESTNWMTKLGSAVATSASNSIATKLGVELGKDPQGDLSLPLTDFDKTMQKSYQAQAGSVLGLQAQKLITDSNIELAAQPRITSDLIAKTNKSISTGLQNIFKNAPTEIQPELEYQYGHAQLMQFSQLSERMIREGREDSRDTLDASNKQNTEMALNLARSGNTEAANSVLETIKNKNEAGYGSRITTREAADVAIKTGKQVVQQGTLIHGYEDALKKGGTDAAENYIRNYAKNKPSDMSYNEWDENGKGLLAHIGYEENLQKQDSQIQLLKAKAMIDADPLGTTGNDILKATDRLDDIQKEQLHLYSIDKIRSAATKKASANAVAANITDSRTISRSTAAEINDGFDLAVQKSIQDNPDLTVNQAEMIVASQAGGAVPNYIKTIEGMLQGTDPNSYQQAGASIDYIYGHGKGQNLNGLNKQSLQSLYLYRSNLKKYQTPQEAATATHLATTNTSSTQRESNDKAWVEFNSATNRNGVPINQFYMNMVSIPRGLIRNPALMSDSIQHDFQSNFYGMQGDASAAKDMTKDMFNLSWGQTYVNGTKEVAQNPIERTIGLPDDSAGMIHYDLADHLNKVIDQSNTMFKDGKLPWHWEQIPKVSIDQAKAAQDKITKMGLIGKTFNHDEYNKQRAIVDEAMSNKPIKLVKRFKSGDIQEYSVVLESNQSFGRTQSGSIVGGWNVTLQDKNGHPSTFDASNPNIGQVNYVPDERAIGKNYLYFNQPNEGREVVKLGARILLKNAQKMYFSEKGVANTEKVLKGLGHAISEGSSEVPILQGIKHLTESISGR